MAYSFDAINQELDPNNKSNIFGQGDTPQGSSGTGAAPTGSGGAGGAIAKTSTEGQIQSPSSSGSGQGQAPDVSSEARQQALNTQVQRQTAPTITKGIGQELEGAKSNLQNEADTYVQGYQNKDYRGGLDQGALQKAVQGDEDTYNKAFSRTHQSDYGNVDQFKPQTQTDFQDVKDLQSSGGIKQLFQRDQGANPYTGQEAAFDTMLLTRNPEFRSIQQQLAKQQQDLSDQARDYQTSKTQSAQDLANQGFTQATQGIQSDLGNIQTGIQSPIEQQAAQIAAERAKLDYGGIESQYAKEIAQQIAANPGQYGFSDPLRGKQFAANALNSYSGVGLSPYVTENKNVDWHNLINSDQAGQFNRISQLLGKNDQYQAGTGPGEAVTYNKQGIQDALAQAARASEAAQEATESKQLQDILSGANQTALTGNAHRGEDVGVYANPAFGETNLNDAILHNFGFNQTFGNTANNYWSSGYGGLQGDAAVNKYLSDMAGRFSGEAQTAVDPNQFYQKAGALSGQDVLSNDQATQLNQLAELTGQANNYHAGSNSAQDQFNKQAYQDALRNWVSSRFGGPGANGNGLLNQTSAALDQRGAAARVNSPF